MTTTDLEYLTILLEGTAPVENAIEAEKALTEKYPAFTLPTELLLKHWQTDLTPGNKNFYLRRIALSVSDPLALSRLENPDAGFPEFYPPREEPETPSTENAIDTFLNTYCPADAADEKETAMLEKLIFNPVPQDYAETLRKENDMAEIQEDETISRIDSFISAHPAARTEPEPAPQAQSAGKETETRSGQLPSPSSSSLLSESLAKIYIKQHRYDKAYEIINQLSLNYPEKSVYFADQLRFLRKLLLIESYKKRVSQKNNIE